jgi:hypothetical protein
MFSNCDMKQKPKVKQVSGANRVDPGFSYGKTRVTRFRDMQQADDFLI